MFSAFLKRAGEQLKNELPFVIYRKPKESLVKGILQKDDQLHYASDYTEKGFVFAPFDKKEQTILLLLDEGLSADFEPKEPSVRTKDRLSREDVEEKEFHLDLIQKGIEYIIAGNLQKVVLSRKIEIGNTESPFSLFNKLLITYSNAFCYLWYHPRVGMWLGATPEILLRAENNRVTTMSLAGTQTYKGNDNPTWGKKELTEQQLVTTYITNVLENKVSDINVSNVESIRAGQLLHLRSKITAKYNNNLDEIICSLHPTPAVCGMPLELAKQFISQNENYHRGFYTGFLGELNHREEIERNRSNRNQENKSYKAIKIATELFVNLRCMQLKEGNVHIYVGGGITKDSDPKKEWLETVAKSNTMLNILD
ncbi:chorismate-binding protein [Maribacter sp. HTCC2170]|uniref:chorismate-binding protein n=1 Tax=Maribacter sp. (strain HTCC2170 / KCCM 42371) TaxID=313603 RepID=UPI00006B2235|nr:chorismate-binding protein [Maribacter sp. HTCC2170]EAR00322.1 isochorismate synthase entC [Maribacter sp. HTCC2170]